MTSRQTEKTKLLEMKNITKTFPGVTALDNVSLSIDRGEVHGICGENGAGKSTLMKILNGIHTPDEGEIFIKGEKVNINHPTEAKNFGIAMVLQELDYVPEFSVEQSLFLGSEPVKTTGRIDWKEVRRQTLEFLEEENLSYPPDKKLKYLDLSDIQILEILKAVKYGAEIILLDEPTSAISQNEIEFLFEKIEHLSSQGVAVLYVSHKLEEVFEICDRISILRDGALVGTKPAVEMTEQEAIKMMVGREINNIYPDKNENKAIDKCALKTQGLSREEEFNDVNLKVHEGEIVGLAGLVGAGRTEVLETIFGLREASEGSIKIFGSELSKGNVNASMEKGLALIGEDRHETGLVQLRNVKENIVLPSAESFFRLGRNLSGKEKEETQNLVAKLDIRTPSIKTLVKKLSGGNQQKVVLAKWLLKEPDIFLLDEPTRGIDVGAKYEIYKLIIELANKGKAILIVSSEMPELIGICDRIYVMSNGIITDELSRNEFGQEKIMESAIENI